MSEELVHWGIKGMKWGRRRYQNKDGSLTPAGRKRYAKLEGELDSLKRKLKKITQLPKLEPSNPVPLPKS